MPALLVLVTQPAPAESVSRAALRGIHGCTPTEARLAQLVAEGHGLRRAANEMGVTYDTARAYLKTVFHKAGVHTQAQRVALVLGGRRTPGGPADDS